MLPKIGVCLRYDRLEDGRAICYIGERVRRTLLRAGGMVIPIAPLQDINYIDTKGSEMPLLSDFSKELIDMMLDEVDGLFLPGGIKFCEYDRYVLKRAIDKKIPILGICLSMQMMGCFEEDVNLLENKTYINHLQDDDNVLSHSVKIDKNSKLYKIIGSEEIMVNSFHKYHTSSNHIYKSVAFSEDGIIEAVEYPGNSFNLGVQWHPEISYEFDDNSKKIIDEFISQARLFSKTKKSNKKELINI